MIIPNPILVRCQYIRLPYYEKNTLFTILASRCEFKHMKLSYFWPDFHGIFTKLEMRNIINHFAQFSTEKGQYQATNWHRKIPAVTSPCKCHISPRRLHNDLCVCPRRSNCVAGDLTARLWRPYGDPLRSFRAALPWRLF